MLDYGELLTLAHRPVRVMSDSPHTPPLQAAKQSQQAWSLSEWMQNQLTGLVLRWTPGFYSVVIPHPETKLQSPISLPLTKQFLQPGLNPRSYEVGLKTQNPQCF